MIPQVYIRINQKAQKMPSRVESGGIFVYINASKSASMLSSEYSTSALYSRQSSI